MAAGCWVYGELIMIWEMRADKEDYVSIYITMSIYGEFKEYDSIAIWQFDQE